MPAACCFAAASYMPCQAYACWAILGAVSLALEVLAEPHRRQILDLLRESEQPVGALVSALPLSQPAVSKHLRVLREAGLVSVRVDAQRRLYCVRAEPLRELDEWLAPYRRMWAERLDDLGQHLAANPD
jgi:DNA-binding transcriptional ArsR family regulator